MNDTRGGDTSLQPIDEHVDHTRGAESGVPLLVYGDYECPYTRKAIRAIEALQAGEDDVLFVYRHFPLTEIHPNALAAAAAAEAAGRQGRFWEMHDLLFHRQRALGEQDLRRYASELGLELESFDRERADAVTMERIQRDVASGEVVGVSGTPTIFIAGEFYPGSYDAASLREVLASARRQS